MKFLVSFGLIFLFFATAAQTQGSGGAFSATPMSGGGVSGPSTGGGLGPNPETACEAVRMLLQAPPECIAGWPILLEQSEQGASRATCRMHRGNEVWRAVLDAARAQAVFCFEGCGADINQGGAALEECNRQINQAKSCLTEKIEEAETRLCG